MSGSDSFNVPKSGGPPLFEVSPIQPHDNEPTPVYGSALVSVGSGATLNTLENLPVIPFVTIVAEDPQRGDHAFAPDIGLARGSAVVVGDPHQEPIVYGSAATIQRLRDRPQYGSGQIVAEDPALYILPPAHKLGASNLPGFATATDQTLAPATLIGGSGGVDPKQDPGVHFVPTQSLAAGSTNDPLSTNVHPPTASASQGNASGVSLLPSMKVDPNLSVIQYPQNLAETGLAVTATNPVAPTSANYQASGQVPLMTVGEQGGPPTTKIPTSQYGQSAP